ncbi:hypothetical protein RJT34_26095 [Clitoria ternatea]|uniref:AAA+ ATPase domain-containing protein n=1 Tax=Clitoria ternatea TaxID=43366 RepID=A0AAN9F8G6_CLITE
MEVFGNAGYSNLVKQECIGDFSDFRNAQNTTKGTFLGSAKAPYHMKISYSDMRQLLWNAVNWIAVMSVVLLIELASMEERGTSNELGTFNVKPIKISNTKFSDVKGVEEAKAELQQIVHYLRDPKHFTRLGGKLPKGVLLVGPPGNGKTMLARALAGEAGVPFFSCCGSEFDETFVGVGAKRVRNLFASAKQYSPCIIFIDEIHGLGGKRKYTDLTRNHRLTLNQLLVELDGFKQNEGIIVIGATDSSQTLDTALLRPGRFDSHVVVPYPDVEGRRQIIEFYMSKVVRDADVDEMILARGTIGFSAAELSNVVNIAALKAAMEGATTVTMAHLEYAKDMIIMGRERKSAVISEESRRISAFHEAGHALVAIYTNGADPVHKATIVPHGNALGLVAQLPAKDTSSITRKQMLAELDVFIGGRVAEELIFGENGVTSGASSDLIRATEIARDMVTKYGMNNEVGIVTHNYKDRGRSISSETRLLIEKDVKQLLDKAYTNAKAILTSHSDEHHAIAEALLERETITGREIKALLAEVKAKEKQQKKP